MSLFRPRIHRAGSAEADVAHTEQTPGPEVIASIAALTPPGRRTVAQRCRPLMQPSDERRGVSIEDLAAAARLMADVDGAATSVQRSLPPMRAPREDSAHEYGADPMLWTRHGARRAAPAEVARPRRGGWLMNLFF